MTVNKEFTVPFAAGVTDAGDKLQVMVTFEGAIVQVSPTDKLKPLREVTVILEVVELPA